MDLLYIRTFLHVAEVGNFTRAAEDLQYAQSTVTSQIQALEKEFGFPLFERVGRKCLLTDAGREFLQYANDIQYITQKIGTIKERSEDAPITLRIGVIESLLFSTMIDLVPLFKEKYPNAELSIQVSPAPNLLELLRQSQLDMVYLSSGLNTDNALTCCYKREERIVFVTSTEHPLAGRRQIPLRDIFSYPLITTEASGHCSRVLRELAADAELEMRPSITINDIDGISLFLRDGRSFSFLPECSLSEHLRNNRLTTLDTQTQTPTYYSQVLLRKSQWLSPPLKFLIGLIHQLKPGTLCHKELLTPQEVGSG